LTDYESTFPIPDWCQCTLYSEMVNAFWKNEDGRAIRGERMIMRFKIYACGITGNYCEPGIGSLLSTISDCIYSLLTGLSGATKADSIQLQKANIPLQISRSKSLSGLGGIAQIRSALL